MLIFFRVFSRISYFFYSYCCCFSVELPNLKGYIYFFYVFFKEAGIFLTCWFFSVIFKHTRDTSLKMFKDISSEKIYEKLSQDNNNENYILCSYIIFLNLMFSKKRKAKQKQRRMLLSLRWQRNKSRSKSIRKQYLNDIYLLTRKIHNFCYLLSTLYIIHIDTPKKHIFFFLHFFSFFIK